MSYSTDNDLLAEVSEYDLAKLTGDSSGTTVDYDRIERSRADADSIINGYLMGRYEVPLPIPYDPLIVKLSIDLTMVHLFEFAYSKSSMPNTMVWRRINALKILSGLTTGVVGLMLLPDTQKILGSILISKECEREYSEIKLADY